MQAWQAALAPQFADCLAVDNAEVQAELVAHLVMPLHLQGCRADNQDAARGSESSIPEPPALPR